MTQHKAVRPTPIKHSFVSKFGGEICPICGSNRLVMVLEYPVCMRCREKYDLTEDLLRELKAHRLLISTDTIDWQEKPYPRVSGLIDDKVPWQASFVMNEKWFVEVCQPSEDRNDIVGLIRQYLVSITPAWLERMKNKKTKIRRYVFIAAVGVSLATTGYFLKKRSDRLKKELKEAEEAERSEKNKPC